MSQSILFLCTGNSARSQLAEAVARQKLGSKFDIASAGTRPESVDSRTLEVLANAGYDSSGLNAKHIDQFADRTFDFVITLCEQASAECGSFPNAEQTLAWNLADPKDQPGIALFEQALTEIEQRVQRFCQIHCYQAKDLQTVVRFQKTLGEALRLSCVLMLHQQEELCVSDFVNALQQVQPKISRCLAQLKQQKVVIDRRQGQKIFYRLAPELEQWQRDIIKVLANSHAVSLRPQQC
ncbi:metalloregulator ArsR/SmtB family transcription factor [Ferrimonas lipolytica]|uniref:Metalloregulator ArsR/SmtB family transcription factor n=1 Tax=Ferrimonas lipolytica TaxID=2724191 RepID=A0A6H1UHT6_9GAMM|nr:metalloregulator ArsR/SmtB family transcription factor [Ferrimonas lipolytica]QIZ78170.1 metalloregulator ArsR/SmtB family transcription factor [Ferrimonas lipolytica]